MVALLAKLTGHTQVRALAQWTALRAHELARLFHFPRATMPHGVTWSRVLGTAVDLPAFEQLLGAALNPLDAAIVPARASIALAIDGNTLRGTIPVGHTQGVHLVAAYLPHHGVAVVQLQVAVKENEITIAPTILAHLDVAGIVVTGDAMYTQRPLSTQIVDAGGDYLWLVKDNQPDLRQDIEQLFEPELNEFGTAALPMDVTTAHAGERTWAHRRAGVDHEQYVAGLQHLAVSGPGLQARTHRHDCTAYAHHGALWRHEHPAQRCRCRALAGPGARALGDRERLARPPRCDAR